MSAIEQFAAARNARLRDAYDELRPIVVDALERYGAAGWSDDLVEAAGVLWTEIFERESPTGDAAVARETFLTELRKTLAKTTEPMDPPADSQIDRITDWIAVYAVNSASYFAGRDSEDQSKTWLTMEDDHVRATHSAVDGQTVPIMATFDVGGSKLHFPGEPVGPPEVWINCRCILATTGGIEMGNKGTAFAVDVEVEDPDTEVDESDLEDEDLVDDIGETPWHGVLVVEGTPTGDKRQFDLGALTYRDFPLPIKFQRQSADGHMGDVVVGTIDEIWAEEEVDGVVEHRGRGRFNNNVPEANEVIDGLAFGMFRGVSIEIDDSEFELDFEETEDGEEDLMGFLFGGGVKLTRFTKARITAASIVATPAFPQAYVALGPDFEDVRDPETVVGDADQGGDAADDETDEELAALEVALANGSTAEVAAVYAGLVAQIAANADIVDKTAEPVDNLDPFLSLTASAAFAPGTKDGPGWVTHPRATARIRRYWTHGKGAAKIRWGVPGDFNRCRRQLAKYVSPAFLAGTCANMHKEALGLWPGRETGKHSVEDVAPFAIIASAASAERDSASYFRNPELSKLTPITVTEDGHVYGHLAQWGTCHIGIAGDCIMPPTSLTKYGFYATGQVLTDDGFFDTGRIVVGTGHAPIRSNLAAASRFYDDTGHAAADVAIGEDGIGIWFSGKVRDDATPAQIKALRASAVSGDWRRASHGGFELVGIISVNAGGYPTPRYGMVDGRQVSILASAGALLPPTERQQIRASMAFDADELHAIGVVVADELEYRASRKERITEARDPELVEAASARRSERIAAARSLEE